MPALPWVAPPEDRPPIRRDPPRPQPTSCEHDGARPPYGVCYCVCRGCWDPKLLLGSRCIDQQCTLHHRPATTPE